MRNSKYGNIIQRGYDSKKEARRGAELELLQRAGHIKNLKRQLKIELVPKFEKDGKKYRAINYVADFYYQENGREIIEEVKGFETDVWKLKKKLILKFTDYELRIIK